MVKKIEPADLLGPAEVAPLIGLNNSTGVSVYRKRYSDFPAPWIEKGRCVLWLRADIETWAANRG